jgi:MFS transporter, AAHS family, 4-hydroxybenzoate transporter
VPVKALKSLFAPSVPIASTNVIVAICFVIAMVDGFDTLMVSFIAPLLAQHWGLSNVEIGKIFGIGFTGAVIGAFVIGPAADRFGRRSMLTLSLALTALATLLCALAETPGQLMILRFVAGLALGGAIPAIVALTAETSAPERRAGMVTLMFLGFPLGAVVGGAVTAAFIHLGWQAIFLGGGVAALVVLPLGRLVPETLPDPSHGDSEIGGSIASSLAGQFGEGRLAATLALWLGVLSILLLTYFLVSWIPTVLTLAGLSPQRAAIGGVVLNLGGIAGALVLAFLINRFGPFRPVAAVLAIGSVMVWLLGQNFGSPATMMAVVLATGVCIIGGQLNIPAMAIRLFPPKVRGAGVGWAMGIGRLGSIVGPTLGGILLAADLGWPRLFLIAAVPALVAALAFVAVGIVRPKQSSPD